MRWIKRGAVLLGLAVLACLAWFSLAINTTLQLPNAAERAGPLLLQNGNLIDLASGEIHSGTDILIEGDRISAIGPQLLVPGAKVVDASGQYVLPGLFDMHVHSLRSSPAIDHLMYIAMGVTAVRDMGGCLGEEDSWIACAADKKRWNREVADGQRIGPRYDQVTSLAINGGKEIPSGWPTELGAPDVEGARRRAAHDSERGIDFLKPYSLLDRDAYLALAAAAKEQGLYLAGHKPLAISGQEAITAGQRSIEHAFLFIWECYPGIDALRKGRNIRAAYTHETRLAMLDTHDTQTCDALMNAMRDARTAFVPTHTTRKLDAYALDEDFRNDERLRYIPAPLRSMWLADADSMANRTTEEGNRSYRDFYEFGLKQTGRAHAKGVMVLAGTDAPDSFVFPGMSLHDELVHLVQVGLSPLAALRAATIEPARFLGIDDVAGSIAVGHRADILLVSGNPLRDIAQTRNIEAVILAGQLYDRPQLNHLLDIAEANANHWSMWAKFVWQAARSPILRAQFRD